MDQGGGSTSRIGREGSGNKGGTREIGMGIDIGTGQKIGVNNFRARP